MFYGCYITQKINFVNIFIKKHQALLPDVRLFTHLMSNVLQKVNKGLPQLCFVKFIGF